MTDPWGGRNNPAIDHMRMLEAENIEKCRTDPNFDHEKICYVCMIPKPVCHCVDRCAFCGKAFGAYGCNCRGGFTSAFDERTGIREYQPPDGNQAKLCHYARGIVVHASMTDLPPSFLDSIRGKMLLRAMRAIPMYQHWLQRWEDAGKNPWRST